MGTSPRPPTAPAERLGESKGMRISTQGKKYERERPSEQIKFPIFKWSRQPKDVSEETSSVQTSGAGAWNQNEIKCIKQWLRQSLFEKGKKAEQEDWKKPITVMLTRTPQHLPLLIYYLQGLQGS